MKARRSLTVLAGAILLASVGSVASPAKEIRNQTQSAQPDGHDHEVTILITAHPHNGKESAAAERLVADDFTVKENGRPQRVLSAKPASVTPLIVEVLIQDNLASRMNNELEGLRRFIKNLPVGTRVLTGYTTTGSLDVRQDFTADRARAAESLRVLTGRGPYSPYNEVIEGLKRFDSQPEGRKVIVLISDGLDLSRGYDNATPDFSVDLGQAIREAQNRGVAVFAVYAPVSDSGGRGRLEFGLGQASLVKLSNDTGGEAFVGVPDPVSLSPYWPEVKDMLSMQWLVTYQSTNAGTGFRRIEVNTESGVHLHHPQGYWSR